jgi:hypothetical protein
MDLEKMEKGEEIKWQGIIKKSIWRGVASGGWKNISEISPE